jgi:hypothetical protein
MRVRMFCAVSGAEVGEVEAASWAGEVDWAGVPRPGDEWSCCTGAGGGHTVGRVVYHVGGGSGYDVLVEATATRDMVDHLIADHGWEPS